MGWQNIPNPAQTPVISEDRSEEITFYHLSADEDFLATYDVPLKSGRNILPRNAPGTGLEVLLNESAAKRWAGKIRLEGY